MGYVGQRGPMAPSSHRTGTQTPDPKCRARAQPAPMGRNGAPRPRYGGFGMGYSIGTPPSPVPGSRGQGTGTALNVSALIKPQRSDPEPTAGSPPQRGRATSQYFAIKRSQVPRGLLPEGVMLVMPHGNGGFGVTPSRGRTQQSCRSPAARSRRQIWTVTPPRHLAPLSQQFKDLPRVQSPQIPGAFSPAPLTSRRTTGLLHTGGQNTGTWPCCSRCTPKPQCSIPPGGNRRAQGLLEPPAPPSGSFLAAGAFSSFTFFSLALLLLEEKVSEALLNSRGKTPTSPSKRFLATCRYRFPGPVVSLRSCRMRTLSASWLACGEKKKHLQGVPHGERGAPRYPTPSR